MLRLACFFRAFKLFGASVLSIVCLLVAPASAEPLPALMPLPKSITATEGALIFTGPLAIAWEGCEASVLDKAVERLHGDIRRQTGLLLDTGEPVTLTIACTEQGKVLDPLQHEAYRLRVNADGLRLEADGPTGVLRGLATVRQLVSLDDGAVRIPFVQVDDAPRFAWRGIMLDPARNFIELSTLKRQLDAMEQLKLNILHLHLSDDQGFRVESKRFPKLNSTPFVGASQVGRFYTQSEIRELIAYAAARGILVVPEFDMPGHSRAMVEAYPEIGIRKTSVLLPALDDVALNPAAPSTYLFLEDLIAEMAELFPSSYFHIGGDEVAAHVWDNNAGVQALMKREGLETHKEVEAYFAARVIDMVRHHGKTPMGWDELVDAGVDSGVIIQAWQTSNETHAAVSHGNKTIVSAGYYLDLLMPTEFHYLMDPMNPSASGFTPEQAEAIREAYPILRNFLSDKLVAKPLPPLGPEQQKLILGAEAPLWGELVSDEMVDARLWPRAAALAERFWSSEEVRDVADMYRRLAAVQDRLTINGLQDRNNRARMILRLSPGQAEPIARFLDLVSPTRNMARDHRIPAMLRGQLIEQPLNTLADAAPTESMVARVFEADVRLFLDGDASLVPSLQARLSDWKYNHQRFIRVAADNELLQVALPTSGLIADLSQVGMQALEAITRGRTLDRKTAKVAAALLSKAEQQETASLLPLVSLVSERPPADLIVAITPGIRLLVDEAIKH